MFKDIIQDEDEDEDEGMIFERFQKGDPHILCRGCKNLCYTEIISFTPFRIKIICHKCKNIYEELYRDFEKQAYQQVLKHSLGHCQNHPENFAEFFCVECTEGFCKKCLDKGNHKLCKNIVNLLTQHSEVNFRRQIVEKINNFNLAFNKIEELYLNRLKEEKRKIKKIFQENRICYAQLFEYYKLLFFNIQQREGVTILNFLRNFKNKHFSELKKQFFAKIRFTLKFQNEALESISFEGDVKNFKTEEKIPEKNPEKVIMIKSFDLRNTPVYSACLIDDQRLGFTSIENNFIIVIGISSKKVLFRMKGHEDWVTSAVKLENGKIASSSMDKTIRIWELEENGYKCLETLEGHKDGINRIITFNNGLLASASEDKAVGIWENVDNKRKPKFLHGHLWGVTDLIKLKSSNVIVSSSSLSSKSAIIFWNINSVIPDGTIDCPENLNNSCLIEAREGIILYGGRKICVIDSFERKIIKAINTGLVTSFCKMKENILFGGLGSLFIFDIENEKVVHLKKVHNNLINSIIWFGKDIVFTSSSDCSIKFWKLIPDVPK